jgi:hypothetical protein
MPKKRIKPPKVKASKMETTNSCHGKDALLGLLRRSFEQIPDHRRDKSVAVTLTDVLMSGFAMFDLKDPSMLAFDDRRCHDADNLKRIFGIDQVACDSQMRVVLDRVDPKLLRPIFRSAAATIQRSKLFQQFAFYEGYYLLSLDGTGSYGSKKVKSASCQVKNHQDGTQTYYQQVLAGAFVHPDHRVVIPVAPEMIIPQDGTAKNDCERNGAKRFLPDFRDDYPRLRVIVVEDGLASNGPHIKDLQEHDMRFILGAKPGDHKLLFDNLDEAIKLGTATTFTLIDPVNPDIIHTFCFLNDTPLNQANSDLNVNALGYEEYNIKTQKRQLFSWVTDIPITESNAYTLMRGGRCRWKIENETFNTLKNQGYHFEHNFGLGKEHLSEVFVMLMMLAFLVDQIQQLCSPLFQAAWQKAGSKRALWDEQRHLFHSFKLDSMTMLYTAIINGFRQSAVDITYDE